MIKYKNVFYAEVETPMTRENILKHLIEMGKKIASYADPRSNLREDIDRAKQYNQPLREMRKAYKHIKGGGDIVAELKRLKYFISGIEGNKLRLLIIANTTGFKSTDSWHVVDGDLVHRNSND